MSDHLRVTDDTFARLREHFSDPELMDLCFQVSTFVGYGRMGSALAMIDELPDAYADPDAVIAPWTQTPASVV